ncbi:hypothetical protein B0H14DRAFT_2589908 [Mycena olivaceomarginata]|nr:hypothetical protein B0H14DRAFT_2589908 [Mycena olivaceomarginata]
MRRSGISRGKIRMLGTSQQQSNSFTPPAVSSKILHGKSLEEHQLHGKEELQEELQGGCGLGDKLTYLLGTDKRDVSLDPQGGSIAPALIMEGLIPCAPFRPSVAITVKVLEVYRVAHARCPQLAIQSLVKTLCDLHRKLREDGSEIPWLRLVFVEAEAHMSSLHVQTRGMSFVVARSTRMEILEQTWSLCWDSRRNIPILVMRATTIIVTGRRSTSGLRSILQMMPKEAIKSNESNLCANRWKSMVEDVTAKMWGIFDETGIFLCLCRHGLIEHPRHNIDNGYDVGCDFQTTIKNSQQCNFQYLVGAFHGHAHNHLCQLSMLATYVLGLACKDLEGLSGSTPFCSILIQGTGKFIANNYKQAVDILKRKMHFAGSKDQTEILEMKYVQKLVNLDASHTKYLVVAGEAKKAQASDAPYTPGVPEAELARHHAREKVDQDLEAVHKLEEKLGISD